MGALTLGAGDGLTRDGSERAGGEDGIDGLTDGARCAGATERGW